MRTFRSLEAISKDLGSTIVSVGNFDGVHRGHQEVLREMICRARIRGCRAVAVTFDPHPARVLRPDSAPKLITPQLVKEKLLAQTGLDDLIVIPFTPDFSA